MFAITIKQQNLNPLSEETVIDLYKDGGTVEPVNNDTLPTANIVIVSHRVALVYNLPVNNDHLCTTTPFLSPIGGRFRQV